MNSTIQDRGYVQGVPNLRKGRPRGEKPQSTFLRGVERRAVVGGGVARVGR